MFAGVRACNFSRSHSKTQARYKSAATVLGWFLEGVEQHGCLEFLDEGNQPAKAACPNVDAFATEEWGAVRCHDATKPAGVNSGTSSTGFGRDRLS